MISGRSELRYWINNSKNIGKSTLLCRWCCKALVIDGICRELCRYVPLPLLARQRSPGRCTGWPGLGAHGSVLGRYRPKGGIPPSPRLVLIFGYVYMLITSRVTSFKFAIDLQLGISNCHGGNESLPTFHKWIYREFYPRRSAGR